MELDLTRFFNYQKIFQFEMFSHFRFIQIGSWMSHQMLGDANLKKYLGEMNKTTKRMVNILPRELEMKPASQDILYPEIMNTHELKYFKNAAKLTESENDAFNVVVLGPTGSGKSTIINQIFNKSVCPTGANAFSVTREVRFYHGKHNFKGNPMEQKTSRFERINIIDTVGNFTL